jgi:glycosyltransferase involved in cell wall biosynthesis
MGIVENIQQRFPETKVQWLPNGVDPEFYDPEKVKSTGFRNRNNIPSDHLVFFYGGILGYAQGLEVILNAASQIDETEKYTVIIQGSGPEEQKLKTMASELSLKNVRFLPSVGKNEMPEVLREVDVALVPLRKLDLFQGAMPSKIFEALSMEKALLLGVEGEAKTHFIDKAGAGLFFEPENSEDLSEKMRSMIRNRPQVVEMGKRGRMYVIDNFNRDKIAQDLIRVLKDI